MNPSAVAIHEAGHFVFAMLMDLGEVTLLTIEQGKTPQGVQSQGRMEHKPTAMERVIRAEQKGAAPSSVIKPAMLARYLAGKPAFVNQLVVMHLAGPAAEKALAGGDGSLSETDYFQSRDAARTIMAPEAVAPFLEQRLAEVCDLCRGAYKPTVMAVAERLQSRRTLNAEACAALWAEVDPRCRAHA